MITDLLIKKIKCEIEKDKKVPKITNDKLMQHIWVIEEIPSKKYSSTKEKIKIYGKPRMKKVLGPILFLFLYLAS